jgi:hypothetical protein
MSEYKSTPGPWRRGKGYGAVVSDSFIGTKDCNDKYGSLAFYGGHLICESASPGNIRLISEAPSLLAIAEDLLEFAIEERKCFYQSVASPDGHIDQDEAETLRIEDERIESARAVIARAKGESA